MKQYVTKVAHGQLHKLTIDWIESDLSRNKMFLMQVTGSKSNQRVSLSTLDTAGDSLLERTITAGRMRNWSWTELDTSS